MIGPIINKPDMFTNCTNCISSRAFDTNGDGINDSTEFKMFLLDFGGNSRNSGF